MLGSGARRSVNLRLMHFCDSCPDPTRMEPASGAAVCPVCGREESAPTQPFLVVTGASGSGKTTLFDPLARELAGEAAVFDIDWLIGPFAMQAAGAALNWPAVRAAWLSVAHALRREACRHCCSGRWRRSTWRTWTRRDG